MTDIYQSAALEFARVLGRARTTLCEHALNAGFKPEYIAFSVPPKPSPGSMISEYLTYRGEIIGSLEVIEVDGTIKICGQAPGLVTDISSENAAVSA